MRGVGLACGAIAVKAHRREEVSHEEQRALDELAKVLDAKTLRSSEPVQQLAQLSDGVFLSDVEEARDPKLLQDRGITAVINLVGWWELASSIGVESSLASFYGSTLAVDPIEELADFYEGNGIAFCASEVSDDMSYDTVKNEWLAVREVLQEWKQEGRKVLVNCKAGQNKSACMLVCWFMAGEGMDLLSAASHVSTLQGNVLSNSSFRLQLVRLALKEGWPLGLGDHGAEAQISIDDVCLDVFRQISTKSDGLGDHGTIDDVRLDVFRQISIKSDGLGDHGAIDDVCLDVFRQISIQSDGGAIDDIRLEKFRQISVKSDRG